MCLEFAPCICFFFNRQQWNRTNLWLQKPEKWSEYSSIHFTKTVSSLLWLLEPILANVGWRWGTPRIGRLFIDWKDYIVWGRNNNRCKNLFFYSKRTFVLSVYISLIKYRNLFSFASTAMPICSTHSLAVKHEPELWYDGDCFSLLLPQLLCSSETCVILRMYLHLCVLFQHDTEVKQPVNRAHAAEAQMRHFFF